MGTNGFCAKYRRCYCAAAEGHVTTKVGVVIQVHELFMHIKLEMIGYNYS
jgi:hypothetical protein